ncbi:MAG: hypothetical protein ACLTX9_05220 [Oscillospiraceae bacterium]|jgi:hypothetical protein|nr:MAG TPA: zinc-ribbon domain protein [Caudoviricetes sp.]DAP42437.1 MAG TPA: zinc-ribbon domain protein [Caudoviricetes sp.]DAZ07055.1 MAG TPA: zinc-ribbon domain protein [Caudoviricetes sp.]
MSDYISREAAMEIVKRTSGDYAAAFSEIRKLPAADAEPVRHGEWLRTDDDWNSLVTIQCSACGGEWCFEIDEDVQLLGYNYCPGCGCKMDLEDETNDD